MSQTSGSVDGAAAREQIRANRSAGKRRVAAIDDDPTGSQSVHDVALVTVLEPDEFAAGLADDLATCFILTNSRSLSPDDAVAVNEQVGRALFEIAKRDGYRVDIISRSDSTLRGHVVEEVTALDRARRDVLGAGFDGVLLAPAMFEAGRYTRDDIHWAVVQGTPTPAGDTEFAKDATFGYTSSNLRDFVAEKSGGEVRAEDVLSIGLDDIRSGGPDRVAEILAQCHDLTWVVVNGTEASDYDTVVLGLQKAQEAGGSFAFRTGPSFCRALAGIEPMGPLTAEQIWPDGRPEGEAHGLITVGSHVGQTARQVARVQERSEGSLAEIELEVSKLIDPATRDEHVAEIVQRVREALTDHDVFLYTSRTLVTGDDAAASLAIARTVSGSLVDVVAGVRDARPAWVIAKGGITSHDVAARGLGIRRGTVAGQLFTGMVSVLRPDSAPDEVLGTPYVVFPGNVGDENALADVIDLFHGVTRTAGGEMVGGEISGEKKAN